MADEYGDEFDIAIERWQTKKEKALSPKSIETYRNGYIRLLNILQRRTIGYVKEKTIISSLNEDENLTPDVKNMMLNVAIICRSSLSLVSAKLEQWRQSKLQRQKASYRLHQHAMLEEELPATDTLNRFLRELKAKKMWKEYIVNFLIINYGVRNQDLNLTITRDKSVISKFNKDLPMNYLYMTKKYAYYIVNVYKTKDSYDQKKYMITRQPFQDACENLLGDDYEHLLLGDIDETSLSNTIQRMTFRNMGETKLFKAVVYNTIKSGNTKRLQELSKSRGTSLETILTDYNVSF